MRPLHPMAAILAAGSILACDGAPSGPAETALTFSESTVELGGARETVVTLHNPGAGALGPVSIQAAPVRGGAGDIPGGRVVASPATIPTLNPGDRVDVTVAVELPAGLQPGSYEGRLTARTDGGGPTADLAVSFAVPDVDLLGVARVVIESPPSDLRQGDAAGLVVVARDTAGAVVEDAPVAWSVSPSDAGFVDGAGRFVGYRPGPVRLVASVGGAADTAHLAITARGLAGSFAVVGRGLETERHTSDLWVHGSWAYLGTWGARGGADGVTRLGDVLHAWDVSDPSAPRRGGSVTVDARVVNDVKVAPDGSLAVITHEGSNDGRNGVSILDLSDPGAPRVLSRFTRGLEPGVHNVWLERRYAYLVVDGTGGGLRILDMGDPADPREVASWYAGTSFLHDVYVREGLAFLSHWNAGLVVLDVGHGIAGGSPESPMEVSRLPDLDGQTHNAWYWPEAGYAFVGEEDFATPGRMHVVDLRDPFRPREVATFAVPGDAPHNFWLDEGRGVLYLAWYGRGIRALDVSGELVGDLARQGREIAGLEYDGDGGCPGAGACTWAPQLHGGHLYLSDMNSGLVVLRPESP